MNNTLVKGLHLLELLAHSERPVGVTALAQRLGIGKSNVHRMLQALVELGYVQRDGDGSYRASLRVCELGAAVLARFDVRQVAMPSMERLLAETRETIHLSVLDADEVVYLHKLDSPEPVRAYTEIGGRAPAHRVATGKAMLAYEDEVRLEALSLRLEGRGAPPAIEAVQFLREMERVRRAGYAVNRGEWRDGVNGVAAPIRDHGGRVVAAIGVSGPAVRVRPSSFKALAVHVLGAAVDVSKALGEGRGAQPMTTLLTAMRRGPARPLPQDPQ